MISVCVGGEFKLYPLAADIRISLGTPVFFFFLLWSRNIKPIKAGVLVGLSVFLFRSCLSALGTEPLSWSASFLGHYPAFLYYFVYGLCFSLFKTRQFYQRPIIIVCIGMIIEIIASIIEIVGRHLFLGFWFPASTFLMIGMIAFFRSFIVLGLFNFFLLHEARLTEAMQKKRNEYMLLHVSNLFVEMVQLKKSMKNAENTTKACYDLYRILNNENSPYAKKVLHIAGEVHEIKKDHQRIYSGLTKLKVKEQPFDLMNIEEIINIALEGNQGYAELLGKSISINVTILGEHPRYNILIMLSLLNNLVANAIEAIENTGIITLLVKRSGENVVFQIQDNGPGIPLNRQTLVFEPGYTTKYDECGIASNGIGLSHIKEVIEDLNGEIQLISDQDKRSTTFFITLPVTTINHIG
nr:ATP-binding protein [uncultured Bacillus sp.]